MSVDRRDVLALAYELLVGLEADELGPFLVEWPQRLERRSPSPVTLPALRWMPQIHASAPPWSARMVAAIAASAELLAWRRSYCAEAVGRLFFENYAWTELAGLSGPVPSRRLACGVLLLGPDLLYPAHRHEAEEIYVPLVGEARWQQGGGGWRLRSPGSVIHHACHEPHAMRSGSEPLLALYLWRSANLDQSSRLDLPPPP